ncbi:hypothetical protein ACOMHN_009469 [Nucella lapillus]
MQLRLITVRNRLDVLLCVFVASYFLCCGDVEVNPGPVDSDSPSQQQHDTEEHNVTVRGNTDDNRDVTTAGPTHSATSNEECKSTGHIPGDGQLRGGDSPGCLNENSGQSDVQGAREGLHHGKGSGGVTVSGRCQSRGHGAEVDSLVDGDSPRLPSGDLRRDSQDTHHTLHSKNSWNERRDLEEHLGRGRDSPPQYEGSQRGSARGARDGVRVGRGGGSGQGQSRVNVTQSRDSQYCRADRISGNNSSRPRRSTRTTQ